VRWPRWVYAATARLRAIAGTRIADHQLDDELAFHVAMQTEENKRRGMDDDEAGRRARIALGVDQTKELTREGRPLHGLELFMNDFRYALRLIRRAPGFAAVAILTIALGIGANTAIFTVVNGVLLRPLPYSEPDRLVRLFLANPAQDVDDGQFSVPDLDDWRSRSQTLQSIAGFQTLTMTLTGLGEPTELQAAFTTGDFFGTVGASTRIGRPVTEADVRQRATNAAISERLWRSRFGGDPNIIGKVLVLGTVAYTVVGVVSSEFRYPTADTDVWAPHSVLSDESVGPRVRSQRILEAVARLVPGATVAQAESEADALAARLASEFASTNKGWSAASVVPLRTAMVGIVDKALLLVLAVVGFILLIACANLANLLLARATTRSHEIATRAALGAGRSRIVRQLLTESLVLSLIGGLIGMAISVYGVRTLVRLSADTLPRVEEIGVDGGVISFAVALVCLTALLFGTLPALRAANADPHPRMRAARGSVGAGRHIRNPLVVAEVALAVVLVIGAGLMARSFLTLRGVEPGFDPRQVLTVTVQFNLAGVTAPVAEYLVMRREQLIERFRALPGVVDVGSITRLPLDDSCRDVLFFVRADGTAARDGGVLRAPNCLVSPGYLKALGIPLVRGEPLPERSAPGAPVPFVISEAAARRFWPNEDPIGQVVRANYGGRAVVVGIVGDVRQDGLATEPPPLVYFNQRIGPRISTALVLRTVGDPLLLAGPIRDTIKALDPNQPIRSIATYEDVAAESIARDKFFTLLFALFGTLALLLAAVGVFGVFSYSVAQRTQEIGVRMALGAQRSHLVGMVVGEGMRLVAAGVALGAVAALLMSRVLRSQLFGISATDPIAFVTAPALLIAVAMLACYLPARRATKIQPVQALRAE
jgi:predicted permease